MTTFLFLVLILLLLLAAYLLQRYRDMTILQRNGIPGPKPNLITGSLFDHSRTPNVLKYDEYFAKYGPIVGYYIGRKANVLINDVELAKRIQIKDFSNFSDRQTLGIKYGLHPNPKYYLHLISAQGAQWKELRTLLNPTFSAVKLKAMTPIMDSCIDILLDKVEKRAASGGEFDLYEAFQLLTTDVIAKCALGIDTDVQNNPDDEFFRAAKRLFDTHPSRFRLMFTCFPELDRVLYPLRRGLQMIEEWRDRAGQCWQKKKNDLLQLMLDAKSSEEEIANTSAATLTIDENSDSEEKDGEEGKPTRAEKSLRNGGNTANGHNNSHSKQKALSKDIVVATAIVFYEAGYETTSDPPGDPGEDPRGGGADVRKEGVFDYNTVNRLPYMNQVISETLRYYPPVTTFVTRTTKEDYHYKDIVIPANSTVRIPINQLHHREDLWPEHMKFDPERFRDRSVIDPVAYQPFGTGPSNCIGMRFAQLEIKLTIARLLHNTEKELTVEYKPITQTPKNGVWVRAVPV
ncbi:Thromboxane-A synthase [Tyrophagus putrescentiae]|nr:Thromboxane-A synthase [Tyrophagus putrescentiae]